MKRLMACTLALLALWLSPVCAHGEWYVFAADTPPEALSETTMQVCEFEGEVLVSFAGDCTLGGESGAAGSKNGFVQTVKREGMAYPFEKLAPLLTQDDVTIVNLEGVLSNRKLPKVKKKYNFKGPTAFAEILTLGGVDAVTLANNHSGDYGPRGYADTRAALQTAGVASFGTDHVAVWQRDGIRIGFTGSTFSLSDGARNTLKRQIDALRALGCQIVIHSMHAGTEYSAAPTAQPRTVAQHVIDMGADLVVGHHPHVAHGMEVVQGVPVVYSLGNAVFGGNARPRDYDALLLQAAFAFEAGQAQSVRLRFYPLCISGTQGRNDYQPRVVHGEQAQRVLDKAEQTTGTQLPEAGVWTEAFALRH